MIVRTLHYVVATNNNNDDSPTIGYAENPTLKYAKKIKYAKRYETRNEV